MICMPAHVRNLTAILLAVCMSGCLSHEGVYLPGCIAFAGDRIMFGDGKFSWEKFTDEVVVDDDGNIVNQFPGYPLHGSFQIDGQLLRMESESGEAMPPMYLHRQDGQHYLLTADEFALWESSGKLADCTLQFNSETAN